MAAKIKSVNASPSTFIRPHQTPPPKKSLREIGMAFFSHCHRQPPKSPPKSAITTSQTWLPKPYSSIHHIYSAPYTTSTGFEPVGLMQTCEVEHPFTTSNRSFPSLSLFGPDLNTISQVPNFILHLESDLDPKPPDLDLNFSEMPINPRDRDIFPSLLLLLGCLVPDSGKKEPLLGPEVGIKVGYISIVIVLDVDGLEKGVSVGLDVRGQLGADGLSYMFMNVESFWLSRLNFEGADGLDKAELDIGLDVPERPPDPPSITVVRLSNISHIVEFQSLIITRNRFRLPKIMYSHSAQFQSLSDLIFCSPTEGLDLDRSTVALDACGYLSIFGSEKGINGCVGLFSVDSVPRYPYQFPP